MSSSSSSYSELISLVNNTEHTFVVETFSCQRKLAITAGTLSGITLLVIGILAFLHVGALSNLSPAGAWALTLIGMASVCISLGYLIYNIRTEKRIRREMDQLLENPTFKPSFSEDAKIIRANRETLQGRYLLLGDDHGLLKLDDMAGILLLERTGDIVLFVDETARDAWIQNTWLAGTQPYSWTELRARPSGVTSDPTPLSGSINDQIDRIVFKNSWKHCSPIEGRCVIVFRDGTAVDPSINGFQAKALIQAVDPTKCSYYSGEGDPAQALANYYPSNVEAEKFLERVKPYRKKHSEEIFRSLASNL